MSVCFLLLSLTAGSFDPLQIMCEVNGFLVPAIIDTGAEISIMSSSCAKRCHLSNIIDTRYSGKAIGVGTSDILGGIDDLQLRIGPINFKNKISILRNSRCDFLIGLDILRRFKCEISFGEKFIKLQVKRNIIRVPLVSNNFLGNNEFCEVGNSIFDETPQQESFASNKLSKIGKLSRQFHPGNRDLDDLDDEDELRRTEFNNEMRNRNNFEDPYDEENEHFVEDILCNSVSMEGV
eukprot:gene31020-40355_t